MLFTHVATRPSVTEPYCFDVVIGSFGIASVYCNLHFKLFVTIRRAYLSINNIVDKIMSLHNRP